MHETLTKPSTDPNITGDHAKPTEQENEQLLKDLDTTLASFITQFSQQRPALCHALQVVLDYCQKQHAVAFTTRDLTTFYGTQAVRFRKPGVGKVTIGHWAANHGQYTKRQRKDPKFFISNTYNIMTFMRQIINLIAQQNDPVKFPVTFQLQMPNDDKERVPYTCRVVRVKKVTG